MSRFQYKFSDQNKKKYVNQKFIKSTNYPKKNNQYFFSKTFI